ncbi:MAG: PilZ domain-containing protein [Betaproteobacteria bacterium]|nr:PilZ domain-containing protein [Betaproteobacteria bacterium]MCL2885402.1 PilZ domain-containing protein [Betaproteobacteria bacterium]
MLEQRRHQRIRFSSPPKVRIGYGGAVDVGGIENLSLSGLMARTALTLEIGHTAGCEFSLFGSPVIDVPLTIVSRIGDVFGGRFQTGPINQVVIEDAVEAALASGHASILTVNQVGSRKIMRITGGFNAALHNDLMHALARVTVDEMDLAAVTAIDQSGLNLCRIATGKHNIAIGAQSPCFAKAWSQAQST